MELEEILKHWSAIYLRPDESKIQDILGDIDVDEDEDEKEMIKLTKKLDKAFKRIKHHCDVGRRLLKNFGNKEAGLFLHKFGLVSTKEFLKKPLTVFATLLGLKIGIAPELLFPLEVCFRKISLELKDESKATLSALGTIGFEDNRCYICLSKELKNHDFMLLATTLFHELVHYKFVLEGIAENKNSREILELTRDFSDSFEKELEAQMEKFFPKELMCGPNFLINLPKIIAEKQEEQEKLSKKGKK